MAAGPFRCSLSPPQEPNPRSWLLALWASGLGRNDPTAFWQIEQCLDILVVFIVESELLTNDKRLCNAPSIYGRRRTTNAVCIVLYCTVYGGRSVICYRPYCYDLSSLHCYNVRGEQTAERENKSARRIITLSMSVSRRRRNNCFDTRGWVATSTAAHSISRHTTALAAAG